MPLPVIRECLSACDRRDAAIALHDLDCTHAAMAPLMAGKEGMDAYNRCFNALSRIISPTKVESAFKKLVGRLKAKQR